MSVTTVQAPSNIPYFDIALKVVAGSADIAQYSQVYIDAQGEVTLNTSSTQKLQGICQNAPKAGQTAIVRIAGVLSRCIAGTAISFGASLMAGGTAGQLITATSTTNSVQGIALEAAAAQGAIFVALLTQSTVTGTLL